MHFDSSAPDTHQWFVEILPGPGKAISQERAEGRIEGWWMGHAYGTLRWAEKVDTRSLTSG